MLLRIFEDYCIVHFVIDFLRILNLFLTAGSCFDATRLQQASVAVKFVTNTTKESKRNLLERLQRLNFNVQVEHPNQKSKMSYVRVQFVSLYSPQPMSGKTMSS